MYQPTSKRPAFSRQARQTSNSQANMTTMSQTSSTECGRLRHKTIRDKRLVDKTMPTTT